MDKKNTAILWDIENVTPPSGTNYIQSIIDKISETGSISYAMAFGDWNKGNIRNIASELAANSFEQFKILHISRSNLDQIHFFVEDIKIIWGHQFCYDWQTNFFLHCT